MNRFTKLVLVGLTLALVLALGLPAVAQDTPASGAPLILPNFGSDPATFNPILSADGTSAAIISRIFPAFIGIDPDTGYFGKGLPQALATDWTISEDGLTYTFTLREDWAWSDGTPITSADVKYFWDILADENNGVNVSGSFTNLRELIESVEAPAPNVVEVKFFEPLCNSLDSAATLQVVPAHYYQQLFPTPADMNDSPENLNPVVNAGPWTFLNFRPGEQVTLGSNVEYPDGVVVPEGWIYKNVADQTVQAEQFLAGQLTYMSVPNARYKEFQQYVADGQFQGFETARTNMRFLAFNTADPANPQPGRDEEGNIIEQGLHPIFGDVRVRQALNYAMNFEEINEGVFLGTGLQMATHSRPDDWAYPQDLQPYPFDLEQAAALLEEAGWVDTDGDGVRNCQGCLYAQEVDPAFEGSPMAFVLETNAGNTSQEALGVLIQDQWKQVGVSVDFQPIDFNLLVEKFTAQTFDAIMIFWGFGFPFDPDGVSVTFGVENDLPNSGFNSVSYYNERVQEILDTARALPGCDQETRRELYSEMYNILHEESPWIWIGVGQVLLVAQNNVEGWSPKPTAANEALWNEESWFVAP